MYQHSDLSWLVQTESSWPSQTSWYVASVYSVPILLCCDNFISPCSIYDRELANVEFNRRIMDYIILSLCYQNWLSFVE